MRCGDICGREGRGGGFVGCNSWLGGGFAGEKALVGCERDEDEGKGWGISEG